MLAIDWANILASDWANILPSKHVSGMLAPSQVPWSFGFLGPTVDNWVCQPAQGLTVGALPGVRLRGHCQALRCPLPGPDSPCGYRLCLRSGMVYTSVKVSMVPCWWVSLEKNKYFRYCNGGSHSWFSVLGNIDAKYSYENDFFLHTGDTESLNVYR